MVRTWQVAPRQAEAPRAGLGTPEPGEGKVKSRVDRRPSCLAPRAPKKGVPEGGSRVPRLAAETLPGCGRVAPSTGYRLLD